MVLLLRVALFNGVDEIYVKGTGGIDYVLHVGGVNLLLSICRIKKNE